MKTKSRVKLFLSVVVALFGLFVFTENSVSADGNQTVSQSQTSEKQTGKIVVQYMDQYDDTVYPSTTYQGQVGSGFQLPKKELALANVKVQWPNDSDVPKTYTAQTQYVTVRYVRDVKAGAITVKFRDDAGNKIKNSENQIFQDMVIPGYLGQAFPWYVLNGYDENYTGRHIVGDTSPFNENPRTVTVVFNRKVSSSSADTFSASQATSQAKDVQTVKSDSSKSNSAVLPNTNASKSSLATVHVLLVAGMIVVLTFGIRLAKNKK